jgi:hypothetical protein
MDTIYPLASLTTVTANVTGSIDVGELPRYAYTGSIDVGELPRYAYSLAPVRTLRLSGSDGRLLLRYHMPALEELHMDRPPGNADAVRVRSFASLRCITLNCQASHGVGLFAVLRSWVGQQMRSVTLLLPSLPDASLPLLDCLQRFVVEHRPLDCALRLDDYDDRRITTRRCVLSWRPCSSLLPTQALDDILDLTVESIPDLPTCATCGATSHH